MKYIFPLLAVILLLMACNNSNVNDLITTPDNIKVEEYTVDIEKDTTLRTSNGALIKIPKGALVATKGKSVVLEIKEAYTIAQMVKSGLTTASDGKPLSSGGMMYINAKDDQDVTINKPIEISLPSKFLEKDMQLYKGVTNDDGTINWVNPEALPENEKLTTIIKGQLLFESECASCHGLGVNKTGPDLAHFKKRYPFEGDWRYYHHTFEVLPRAVDTVTSEYSANVRTHYPDFFLYKCFLKKTWPGPTASYKYNSDSDDTYGKIFEYIQNESDRRSIALPAHSYLMDCADSCAIYKETISGIQHQQEKIVKERQALIKENGPLVINTWDSTWPVSQGPITRDPEKVAPEEYEGEYYQFNISSFGWINIDMLLNDVPGVEESELFVKVTGDYQKRIKTYLIIPSTKTYGEGGPADRNKEEFAFFYKTGKIPLPQNATAYILAITDTEAGPAWGIKEFITSRSQTIEISLSVGTKEGFDKAINQLALDRLHIKVDDSVNADSIRQADKQIKTFEAALLNAERLKPKGCDCECGSEGDAGTVYR